jgi:hypothetical protein
LSCSILHKASPNRNPNIKSLVLTLIFQWDEAPWGCLPHASGNRRIVHREIVRPGLAGVGSIQAGTDFQLSRGTNGKWTERVLHTFGKSHDGSGPDDSLIFDAAGNLYGTTYEGGIYGVGIVFEITQ